MSSRSRPSHDGSTPRRAAAGAHAVWATGHGGDSRRWVLASRSCAGRDAWPALTGSSAAAEEEIDLVGGEVSPVSACRRSVARAPGSPARGGPRASCDLLRARSSPLLPVRCGALEPCRAVFHRGVLHDTACLYAVFGAL
ncbi:unnamed protein product [Diplocarpon coronariae]